MESRFLSALGSGRALVADGGVGTTLQGLGLEPGQAPEEWVFDRPDEVLRVHERFVLAGADIILTNTFGGTRVRLGDSAYSGRTFELNRRAVELAREAAEGHDALVAGAIGPTGRLFTTLPFGSLEPDEAVDAFAEQAAALTEGGADLLVIETQFALEEALAAVEGASRASDLPLVVSFSFDSGTRTMMGVGASQVATTFSGLGVTAVGANCGSTLEATATVIEEMAAAVPGLTLWAKPNAGMPTPGAFPAHYPVTPEQSAEVAVRLAAAGARIVGGCCGTTAEHVRAIAGALGSQARA